MIPAYQCPKCGNMHMVVVTQTATIQARAFLWWTWVAREPSGFIVRCMRHGCGRAWRMGLDGVYEPAGSEAVPAPNLRRATRDDDGSDPPEYEPPMPMDGAIRRADMSND